MVFILRLVMRIKSTISPPEGHVRRAKLWNYSADEQGSPVPEALETDQFWQLVHQSHSVTAICLLQIPTTVIALDDYRPVANKSLYALSAAKPHHCTVLTSRSVHGSRTAPSTPFLASSLGL